MKEFNTPKHYVLSDGSDSMGALAKILGPEEFKGFLRGNAIKYLIRYKQKGGIGDLKKAMDYIKRLLAVEEAEEKEREFIKKSNPLRYKDEEEEEDDEEEETYESDIAGLIKAAIASMYLSGGRDELSRKDNEE